MPFRFFAKRKGSDYMLVSEAFDFVEKVYSAESLGNITSKYCEIQIEEFGKVRVIEMNIEWLSPAAIKSTNDNNQYILDKPKEASEDLIGPLERKIIAQMIMDRLGEYGQKFKFDLTKLLEQYPMEKEVADIFPFIKIA